MAKRFTERQRRRIQGLLLERDGPNCRACGASPNGTTNHIDHIDNDKGNDVESNWQFLCASCNTGKLNRHKASLARLGESVQRRVTNKDKDHDPSLNTPPLHLNEENLPSVVHMSRANRKAFLRWITDRLDREDSVVYTDVLYAGAKIIDCDPESIRKYLKIESSTAGTIEVYREEMGTQRVRLRTLEGVRQCKT